LHRDGYGKIRWRLKMAGAHRVSWELARGSVPAGLCVLHSCDNPPCVNPDHLFLGTQLSNVHDRDAKGRGVAPCGEAHGCAKLTDTEVREIRVLYAAGELSLRRIGDRYGVHNRTIGRIVSGKGWRHV